jgi:hypothetical protein
MSDHGKGTIGRSSDQVARFFSADLLVRASGLDPHFVAELARGEEALFAAVRAELVLIELCRWRRFVRDAVSAVAEDERAVRAVGHLFADEIRDRFVKVEISQLTEPEFPENWPSLAAVEGTYQEFRLGEHVAEVLSGIEEPDPDSPRERLGHSAFFVLRQLCWAPNPGAEGIARTVVRAALEGKMQDGKILTERGLMDGSGKFAQGGSKKGCGLVLVFLPGLLWLLM